MKVYAHSGFICLRIEFTILYHWRVGDINYCWIFTVTTVKILDASFQVRMFFHRQWIVLLFYLKQQEEEIQIL